MHYSDDFFLVSPNDNTKAEQELTTVKSAFSYLGVPIAEDKLEGPTTSLTFLGINIISSTFSISIPDDKYRKLSTLLPT